MRASVICKYYPVGNQVDTMVACTATFLWINSTICYHTLTGSIHDYWPPSGYSIWGTRVWLFKLIWPTYSIRHVYKVLFINKFRKSELPIWEISISISTWSSVWSLTCEDMSSTLFNYWPPFILTIPKWSGETNMLAGDTAIDTAEKPECHEDLQNNRNADLHKLNIT